MIEDYKDQIDNDNVKIISLFGIQDSKYLLLMNI
jgi:hypothetical protein